MHKNFKIAFKPGYSLFIGFISMALICIFTISGTFNISATHIEDNKRWTEDYATYREQFLDMKNLNCKDSDSLAQAINLIRCNQIAIIDRQAEIISDLRQETNNIIDKLNLWIAFVTIIMSAVGVFIPWWIQFIKDKDFKEEFIKFKGTTVKNLNRHMKNKISEVDEKIKDIYESATLQEMRSKFLSLSLGYETRLINHQSERERLFSFLWTRTVDAFNQAIEMAFKDVDKEKSRKYIIECLVLLCSFVSKIKGSTVLQRTRSWDGLQDEIRQLIKEVNEGPSNEQYWKICREHFEEFLNKLNKVYLPE